MFQGICLETRSVILLRNQCTWTLETYNGSRNEKHLCRHDISLVWRIMLHFISILMFIFFHYHLWVWVVKYWIMMFLSHSFRKVLGILFKFLVCHMVWIHTCCNWIREVSKMAAPCSGGLKHFQLKHKEWYFTDLGNLLWLLIIWKYRNMTDGL